MSLRLYITGLIVCMVSLRKNMRVSGFCMRFVANIFHVVANSFHELMNSCQE